mmetsp:Transcript_51432/g.137933  ORF Transcript_51432/g.137933 Transcript_51432/m.137933 type:complete len:309 (-) Transcript_51432:231-1157(-)
MKGACVPLALLLEEADQTRSEAHRSRRGAQGSLPNKADTERSLSLSEGDDLPADALHRSLLTLGCQCRHIIRILVRIRRLLGACGGGWGREARKVWSELTTTLEAASGGLAPNAALQMLGSTSLIRPIVDRFDDGHGRHVAPARCLAPAALGPQPAAAAAGRAAPAGVAVLVVHGTCVGVEGDPRPAAAVWPCPIHGVGLRRLRHRSGLRLLLRVQAFVVHRPGVVALEDATRGLKLGEAHAAFELPHVRLELELRSIQKVGGPLTARAHHAPRAGKGGNTAILLGRTSLGLSSCGLRKHHLLLVVRP